MLIVVDVASLVQPSRPLRGHYRPSKDAEANPMFDAKSHHAVVVGSLFLRNRVGAGDDLT